MQILLSLVMVCYALTILCLGSLVFGPKAPPEDNASSLRLTVVTPGYELATSLIAPFGPGFERDLVTEFCKPYDCEARWVQAPDRQRAMEMLRKGEADLAAGFDGEETVLPDIAAGPVYSHSEQVAVRATSPLVGSAALRQDRLAATEEGMDGDSSWRQYRLDSRSWSLWEPFAAVVNDTASGSVQATPGAQRQYRWFWRVGNTLMHTRLESFWKELHRPDNTVLARLEDRYYGYLPENVNPYAVVDLMRILERRLPRYSSVIARASDRADINPLLFTAVIIQESGMDERTVSHTGVRGIMQLTRNTAAYLKVDRMDPVAAIGAGARYLRMLWQDLEALELDVWDRWFFTLAAFNQGPRRLEGAMELSRKLGGTGRTWSELKAVYPLLTQKKYADMVGQSVCRGQEAVNFVERVRMSYHILRGLVALERPEAQNLGPLLRGLEISALRF